MNYNIHEPWKTLDPWQEKYIATKGNCFLLCGRQSGKTTAASIKFGERAVNNPKRIILMAAFTEKQAYNLFFKTLMYLKAKYPKMIKGGLHKPTKHQIQLTNGSIIMCYAVGLTGEGIRTYTITDMCIDEAAPMAREVFIALMPMLSVTKGTLDLLSTPRRKSGFFYEASKDPDFEHFYVSAEDCPRHTEEFLAKQRKVMTPREYAQEYLARFMDDIFQYYSNDWIKEVCTGKRREKIDEKGIYFYGCDVARRDKDEFTHEIFDRQDRKKLIHVENIMTKNVPIPESVRTIISLNRQYNFRKEYIDTGGMGINVSDMLKEDSVNKRKVVEINNASRFIDKDHRKKFFKPELHHNLLILGENNEVILLDDDEVKRSLQSIQYDYDDNDKIKIWGNYSHITEGIIRACWCVKDKSLKVYLVY